VDETSSWRAAGGDLRPPHFAKHRILGFSPRPGRSGQLATIHLATNMIAWQEFLSANPLVCGGEICANGTRIPVTVILDSLAEGSTAEEIQASYPSLSRQHIAAALAYAAELAHEESLVPIRAK